VSEAQDLEGAVLGPRPQPALPGPLAIPTYGLGGTPLRANHPNPDAFTPRALYALIVVAYVASAVSALGIARRPVRLAGLAFAQIATDLLLTSGLVYLTGGAGSGFTFLFGVTVLVASLVGSGRGASLVAGMTLVLYVTIALGLSTGWLPGPPDQVTAEYGFQGAELANALLRNLVGLVVVGGLAATLADRLGHARSELDRATESAAGYARLHEDVVRSLSSGLMTLDGDDRIRTANPAAATLLGAESAELLLGEPIRRYLDSASSSERSEGQARRHDGSTFPVGFTRAPLRSADGAVQGAIVIFQDLTELSALRRKAERADRLAVLGSLAAGLAHEIRNPLGSIAGSVELVRDATALEAEDRRLLDAVLRETDRLNELVTTMLEVGRAGPAERAMVPVGPIAREVANLARRSTSEVSVEVVTEPDDDVVAAIDSQQIRQVLWNLVRNAIQFSPRGGTVRVRVVGGEDALTLEVSDEGPGISEADRAQLFDMFFTRRRGGVGLGLTLSKQIVEAHQGEIVALPGAKQGSVFRVRIPHVAARSSEPPRASMPSPAMPAS